MPPQSRGNMLHSKSTPTLPTLRSTKSESSTHSSHQPANTDSSFDPRSSTESWPSEANSLDTFTLDADSSTSSDSDAPTPPTTRPSISRSATFLGPAAFAPPFYNRPPTPLPPSPSLTSLLRPNFSIPSRPTTPDHSSDDGASTRGGSVVSAAVVSTLTSSFRTARPVARASPKVPTYEYYGFTLYLASSAFMTMYILWAFLPSPFLHQLGIYYYPNRWWALAGPAWLVMLVVWIYVALAGWNTERETLQLGDVRTVVDEAANIAVVDREGRIVRGRMGMATKDRELEEERRDWTDWRGVWDEGTDAVMDIPVGGVCEVLYGEGREEI